MIVEPKSLDEWEALWTKQRAAIDRVEFISDRIEAQAPIVTDPMTSMAAREPDVWITMLAGT